MPSTFACVLLAVAWCLSGCVVRPAPVDNPDLAITQRPRSMPVQLDITVLYRLSERPAAHARVLVVGDGMKERRAWTTDAAGELRLRGLPPGNYDLCAVHGKHRGGALFPVRAGQRVRITLWLYSPGEDGSCDLFLGPGGATSPLPPLTRMSP